MRTLVPDPPPTEVQALLERRRRSGLDRFDEDGSSRLATDPIALPFPSRAPQAPGHLTFS